jgi:hypothetical protein
LFFTLGKIIIHSSSSFSSKLNKKSIPDVKKLTVNDFQQESNQGTYNPHSHTASFVLTNKLIAQALASSVSLI